MAFTPTTYKSELQIISAHITHGSVTLTFPWGTYTGTFSSNLAHGFGQQSIHSTVSSPAAVYRGEWLRGRRSGNGRLEIASMGTVYEGGWEEGLAEGYGKWTRLRDGVAEEWDEGGWKRGRLMGWGVSWTRDSVGGVGWSTGGWKDGIRNGYSVRFDGGHLVRYEALKDGIVHGYRTTKRDGAVLSREFFLDGKVAVQPTSQVQQDWIPTAISFPAADAKYLGATHTYNAEVTFPNGDTYTGSLQYGLPHGYGKLHCSIDHRRPGTYEGGWKHGLACGHGTWVGRDGNMYEGGWIGGAPFGYGRIRTGTETFDTFWEDGMGWRFSQFVGQWPGAVADPNPPFMFIAPNSPFARR
jgi:hypothetical protein